MVAIHQRIDKDSEPYEAALDKALSEREAVEKELRDSKARTADLEGRAAELSRVIDTLLGILPPDARKRYGERAAQIQPTKPPAHGSPVYDNVVHLFAEAGRRDWTAPDVQAALRRKGIETDLKPVHNVLNYLAREGRLQRVSRGRYVVLGYGVGIVTSDPLLGHDE